MRTGNRSQAPGPRQDDSGASFRISFAGAAVTVPAEGHERTLFAASDLVLEHPRTVLIGENGSGKSTLLRTLNSLTPLTQGHLRLRSGTSEIDAVASPKAARTAVGFVFSDPLSQLLMPTPAEDVALSIRRGSASQRRREAVQWLERFGAAHLAEQSVYELSSGERQRVALAAVLAADPKILVLDEPTTLLDRRQVRRLMRFLEELPIPVIMATHDLEAASAFGQALWIQDGTVRAQGPTQEIVRSYRDHIDAGEDPA